MEYKWISQDKNGCIAKYYRKPQKDSIEWFESPQEIVQKGGLCKNIQWKNSLINLETHDYKIEDGILMKVEKKQVFKGSELQYKDYDGTWQDCTTYLEYRIKPKTKVVRFRTYLSTDCYVRIAEEGEPGRSDFKAWIGDWQEVTIPEQQEKWPSELVARIAKIDLKAAEWLRDNWDSEIIGDSRDSEHLSTLMVWYKTPQGDKYWRDIANQL